MDFATIFTMTMMKFKIKENVVDYRLISRHGIETKK
jgi:hypothetical protein